MLSDVLLQQRIAIAARAAVDEHDHFLLRETQGGESRRITDLFDRLQLREMIAGPDGSERELHTGRADTGGIEPRPSVSIPGPFERFEAPRQLFELRATPRQARCPETHPAADIIADQKGIEDTLGEEGRANGMALCPG